jgi:hypothetical protein
MTEPITPEQDWQRIVGVLNQGESAADWQEMRGCIGSLITWMEMKKPLPKNCVIQPALTPEGFLHLLYLMKYGTDDLDTCGVTPEYAAFLRRQQEGGTP